MKAIQVCQYHHLKIVNGIIGIKFYNLLAYNPPEWADELQYKPKHRLKLAMLPTPIIKWNLPGLRNNIELSIKRDDMTGCTLSGNKIRKLEFILAKALFEGCNTVITCGGVQSNHCRTVAVAARELGLDCHLFLRTSSTEASMIKQPGNMLLDLFVGSTIHFVPKSAKYDTEIRPLQESLAEDIAIQSGSKSMCIPIGGSNATGLFGYIEAWDEMIGQDLLKDFDDVIVACGSGGTAAGLAISNYLTGEKLNVHAVSVCDDKTYFHDHINQTLLKLGLFGVRSEDIIDIIDGYKGAGYGRSNSSDISMIQNVSAATGIFLDPVYTGKSVKGLIQEVSFNFQRFKGKRILYIHTGGLFSLFDGKMNNKLNAMFHKLVR